MCDGTCALSERDNYKEKPPNVTNPISLESRGERGNTNEAQEGDVEGDAGGAVLLAVIAGVDVAIARAGAVGVFVGLVVVAGASEGARNAAVAALVAGGSLLELLARALHVAGGGDVEGALDNVELGEINPGESRQFFLLLPRRLET